MKICQVCRFPTHPTNMCICTPDEKAQGNKEIRRRLDIIRGGTSSTSVDVATPTLTDKELDRLIEERR